MVITFTWTDVLIAGLYALGAALGGWAIVALWRSYHPKDRYPGGV